MRGWRACNRAMAKRRPKLTMSRRDFSGFCGLTSHQTSSSPRRLSATRLISRCPSCAGLKDPPNRPTRRPAQLGPVKRPGSDFMLAGISGPDLPAAAHLVFIAGQLFDADRPARMHLAGGDADLGPHAEFAAVGELGRGVDQHDAAVDFVEESLG